MIIILTNFVFFPIQFYFLELLFNSDFFFFSFTNFSSFPLFINLSFSILNLLSVISIANSNYSGEYFTNNACNYLLLSVLYPIIYFILISSRSLYEI